MGEPSSTPENPFAAATPAKPEAQPVKKEVVEKAVNPVATAPVKDAAHHLDAVKKHTDARLSQILGPEDETKDVGEDYFDQEDILWIFQRVALRIIKAILFLAILVFLIWFIWDPSENPLTGVMDKKSRSPLPSTIEEKTSKDIQAEPELVQILEEDFSLQDDSVELLGQEVADVLLAEDTPLVLSFSSLENFGPVVPAIPMERQDLILASGWHEWLERMIFYQDAQVTSQSIAWLKDSRSFFEVPLPQLVAGVDEKSRTVNLDRTLVSTRSLILRGRVIRAQLMAQVQDLSAKAVALGPDRKARQQAFVAGVRGFDQRVADKALAEKIILDQQYLKFIAERDARQLVLNSMVPYERMFPRVEELLIGNREAIIKNVHVVNFPGDPFHTILTPGQWREGMLNIER